MMSLEVLEDDVENERDEFKLYRRIPEGSESEVLADQGQTHSVLPIAKDMVEYPEKVWWRRILFVCVCVLSQLCNSEACKALV